MEELYTKAQVIELLKEQRFALSDDANEWNEPPLPTPIQAIPVEKVKKVVKDALEKRIKDLEYSLEFLKNPDYLEESLRSRLLRAKQEAFLDSYVLIQILLSDGK